jgi:hypothetical protein
MIISAVFPLCRVKFLILEGLFWTAKVSEKRSIAVYQKSVLCDCSHYCTNCYNNLNYPSDLSKISKV